MVVPLLNLTVTMPLAAPLGMVAKMVLAVFAPAPGARMPPKRTSETVLKVLPQMVTWSPGIPIQAWPERPPELLMMVEMAWANAGRAPQKSRATITTKQG